MLVQILCHVYSLLRQSYQSCSEQHQIIYIRDYLLEIALDELQENEQLTRIDGVDILIEDSELRMLDGCTIEPDGPGFIFTMSVEAWCRLNDYKD